MYLLFFLPAQVCFWWFRGFFWCSLLGIRMLICSNHSYQPGSAMPPSFSFFLGGLAWSILVGRSVRDKWVYRCPGWGRRRSLRVTRSSPMWGSSSTSGLAHLVFQLQSNYLIQFQSTSTSAPVPVYFDQCSSFQSTSTSAPVPVHFDQCSSSSLLHPRTIPIGISLLQGLIFIGISLLQRTHLHWDFSSARTHLDSSQWQSVLWNVLFVSFLFFFVCVYVYFSCNFCSNVSLKCCSCVLSCIFNIIIIVNFEGNVSDNNLIFYIFDS